MNIHHQKKRQKIVYRENKQNKIDFEILLSSVQILTTCRDFAEKSN